ncbi:MAG TPA: nucleoside transporter C-terminal domain-containing protein [Candidatus Marinimicrobia bacterium]|nr:nucleoside transporter C-terminal domain-containing protein [Candidatus Neomarinimicrobiota bacterium]HRS51115.1 nucleoside transporter C-terminal domain-containing protein [Candidatus Neomarinimicrobiota bacterium]
MRFIGIIGLLVLLGIAFLMSNNRRKISLRVVIWGLLLQLLFAGIILGKMLISYLTLFIFLLLIIIFIYKDQINMVGHRSKQWLYIGLICIVTVLAIAAFYWFGKTGWLAELIGLVILAIVIKSIFKVRPWQKELIAACLAAGLSWLILHGYTGQDVFAFISQKVEKFLGLATLGAEFLFGNLALDKYFFPSETTWPGFGMQFAFTVLPVIIFFASFMAILYHLGVMQTIIKAMARFMQWTMGTSGAETISCAANIFVGQTEAPLLIRPYIDQLTLSELLTVMVGGFATIAGGVLAGYIKMGIPAGHLIAASVMSAPAVLVIAKIIYPETGHSQTAGDADLPVDTIKSANLLDAAARGVTDGLKIAATVGAMLIAFIALIGLVDSILGFLDRLIDGNLLKGTYAAYTNSSGFSPVKGEFSGIFPGSLKTLFSSILRPLAWLMGVSWQYAGEVGNLMGIKISLNEFVAYSALSELIHKGALDQKAIVIATYALCGFANFASIGIQIGGISSLAPSRRSDLSRVALKAMFGGALASWMTAIIAGLLL